MTRSAFYSTELQTYSEILSSSPLVFFFIRMSVYYFSHLITRITIRLLTLLFSENLSFILFK